MAMTMTTTMMTMVTMIIFFFTKANADVRRPNESVVESEMGGSEVAQGCEVTQSELTDWSKYIKDVGLDVTSQWGIELKNTE